MLSYANDPSFSIPLLFRVILTSTATTPEPSSRPT